MNHENERGVLYLTSFRDWVQLVRAPGFRPSRHPNVVGDPGQD